MLSMHTYKLKPLLWVALNIGTKQKNSTVRKKKSCLITIEPNSREENFLQWKRFQEQNQNYIVQIQTFPKSESNAHLQGPPHSTNMWSQDLELHLKLTEMEYGQSGSDVSTQAYLLFPLGAILQTQVMESLIVPLQSDC